MEFRRATIRIASNYGRLIASVCLSVYLFRVLTERLGDDAVGLVFLLTSTVGIAAVVEEATSWSMIRELGASHHGGDPAAFRRMFNSAFALSAALAGLILIIFVIVLLCLPLMKISDGLLTAARWFVIAKALETAVLVLLAPQFNMYMVIERMVAYNAWLTMRRVSAVVAAVSLYWLVANDDPARGLIIYGWISCSVMVIVAVVAAAIITVQDRRLVPSLAYVSRDGLRSLLGISGWNLGIIFAQTLMLPLGAIIMNLAFGLKFNQIFGYGSMLAGYARMLASGMTVGLDAVAARKSTVDSDASMKSLVQSSTLLHGMAVFPAAICIGMLAEPLLVLWLGSKVQSDPVATLSAAATLTRILLAGFAAMLLCDCWTRILFGAGFVRRYAPLIIGGNLIAPIVAVLLLAVLPSQIRYTAVAWAFAGIYIVCFLGFIPRITARSLRMTTWEVVQPLFKPLIAAVCCAPILSVFLLQVQAWNVFWLAVAGASYSVVYAAVTWFFVLLPTDRQRLLTVARNRLMVHSRPA